MKRKIEMLLNAVILALALALAVFFGMDDNLTATIGFAVIAVLNGVALALRVKQSRE